MPKYKILFQIKRITFKGQTKIDDLNDKLDLLKSQFVILLLKR